MTEREMILEAMKTPPPGGYYAWDGKDEEDRPATKEELQAGIEAFRKSRDRPAGSGTKEQEVIRFGKEVLAALRASGQSWQTRITETV